jgi:NmrA-like family
MKSVLILSANGRFGQAAVQAFAAAGFRVLAQTRRAGSEALPPGAVALTTPLSDTAALTKAAAGVQTVVYTINPPYTQWDAQALPLFREGLAVARALGATFMLPGNVYNFGSHLPARLREDTPAEQPGTEPFETLHFAGHTLTGHELLAALDGVAATLGLRPAQGFKVGGMPWGLIRAVGMVYPLWRELARMSYLWRMPHALDGQRLSARVALAPGTPLAQALRQSLIDLGLAAAVQSTPLPA